MGVAAAGKRQKASIPLHARRMPSTDDDRDKLGEALYMKIRGYQPELAGKITGMMLDSLEDKEIDALLADESVLRTKIDQAKEVLEENSGPKDAKPNGKADDSKAKVLELMEELQEAEKWAEDMQKEWDEKEASFTKEKGDLKTRLAAAEERAKGASKSNNGADKLDVLTSKAAAAEKRAEESAKAQEKAKADAAQEAKKLQGRISELEGNLGKATKRADAAEQDAAKAQEKATSASNGSHDKISKLEQELEAAQKNGNSKEKAAPAPASADVDALKSKVQKAEILAEAYKAKVTEAELRASEAEAQLEEKKSSADRDQGKADRCRELQQELENAHRDIKSFKSQLKAGNGDKKDSKSVDKRLSEAQSEVAFLKKLAQDAGLAIPEMHPPESEPATTPAPKASKPSKPKPVQLPLPKQEEPQEEQEDEEDEEESETPAVEAPRGKDSSKIVPDAKNKATPTLTAAGKIKKKGAAANGSAIPIGVASSASAASATKKNSSFECTGTHVVAGCLAVVVMIQVGLFVYEGVSGEQTWAQ